MTHFEPERKLIKERANYRASYLHNLNGNLENIVIFQRFMTLIMLQIVNTSEQARLICTTIKTIKHIGQHLYIEENARDWKLS